MTASTHRPRRTRATLDLNCANFSSCFVSEVNFNTVFSRHADPIDCPLGSYFY